jgi:hypothetical protein
MLRHVARLITAFCLCYTAAVFADASDGRVKVLFLGDQGHHKPGERLNQAYTPLAERGVDLYYTEDLADFNPSTLARYHVVMIYANTTTIAADQEKALIDYVRNGGGLAPIHCASYCFHNSEQYVRLVGAQFKSHKTGEFGVTNVAPDHPVMRGLAGFSSWDETYIHHRHNPDRLVLEVRPDNGADEPWTWVRREGKGRVFYTAWGHDERTWSKTGFINLLERGIRWAAGDWAMDRKPQPPPFVYDEVKLPWYIPGAGRKGDGVWEKMPRPLSVDESMKRMILPPGFQVRYFAGEPDIRNPLCMAWDERGRLWIAESQDYPNELQEPGRGRDRIVICQDTDRDGRADRFTVFADKLSIPTSMAFAQGGVIVHQAPHTLFLQDTDGDDKADVRRTIITGWGTRDTHAGPSNLQYGLDNWIWGVQGYSGFDGQIQGRTAKFGMGFHRFRPDGSQLEFVRQTNNNTWGLGIAEDGTIFGSTANNNPSVQPALANRHYESVADFKPGVLPPIAQSPRFLAATTKVRQVDVHGGYTAAAGHAIYTARQFPREYWNRIAFVAEPTGHLIGAFVIDRDGAGYKTANRFNLLASDDEWTSPIMAEVGPDGSLWFIDWYAYIVQHNPTPAGYPTGKGGAYEIPLRSKRLSRVYRISYGAPADDGFTLAGADSARLIRTLQHDNQFWRKHAQRLLVERGDRSVVPDLIRLAADSAVDPAGLNVGAIHALWTMHGLGALGGDDPAALAAVKSALKHPSAAVRRNAAAVLPEQADSTAAMLAANLLNDPDAQVRLAALLELSRMPADESAGKALHDGMIRKSFGEDRLLLDALTIAAARHHRSFLAAHTASATAHDAHAAHAPAFEPRNLVVNGGFEQVRDGQPVGWTARTYGSVPLASRVFDGQAHTGKSSAMIDASDADGADAAYSQVVAVKPNTPYRLSGWVRTQRIETTGGARGALLNVHELQGPDKVATAALKGAADWIRLQTTFNSRDRESITINCLVGGWGKATGQAWFDDIELVEMAPGAPGGKADEILARVSHHAAVQSGRAVAGEAAARQKVDLELKLATIQNLMKYDQAELRARPGQALRIVFSNNDHMPHNLLILQPGSLEAVGAAADKMALDPQAMIGGFIPKLPQVLAHTKLVNPGEADVLEIQLPGVPGRYPYVCTFPGHWRLMQGVLIVE